MGRPFRVERVEQVVLPRRRGAGRGDYSRLIAKMRSSST